MGVGLQLLYFRDCRFECHACLCLVFLCVIYVDDRSLGEILGVCESNCV
jgi:hypothetical protein